MNYKINWSQDYPTISFHQTLEVNDIIEALNIIIGDARFDYLKCIIADFENVDSVKVTIKDINKINIFAKTASQWNNTIRIANITSDKKLSTLISLFKFSMAQSNWQIRVFPNTKEAYIWGLQENQYSLEEQL